jgi:hypothetical protein
MKLFELPIWSMPKRVFVCVLDRIKLFFKKKEK